MIKEITLECKKGDVSCVYEKPITLKDVAEKSTFSLRTVKKVLSGDETVRPDTKEHILLVAKELGYRKNRMASVLATNKVHNIAIVIGDFKYFFPEAKAGFGKCYREYRELKIGIEFFTPENESVMASKELLQELLENDKIDAVIMHACSMSGLNREINALVKKGKPVFTFGADAPSSDRICYVGPKAYESGRIAAQIMVNYIGKKGNVFIVNQSIEEMQTVERNRGFMDFIMEYCPEVKVQQITVQKNEKEYYNKVRSLIETQQVSGILGADADCYIVGNVLRDLKNRDITAMGFDLSDDTEQLLKEDYFKVVLSQNPDKQAYKVLQKMCDYISYGVKVKKNIYTDVSIITSECLRYREE